MGWYWYWLFFLGGSAGVMYGLFVGLPAWWHGQRGKRHDTAKSENVIEANEEEPVKNCPICSEGMRKDSLNGIIVDRCVLHGIWFDSGELESVVNFVKSGGNVDGFISGLGVDQH